MATEKPIRYPEEMNPTEGLPNVDPMGGYPVGPTKALPGSGPSMQLPGRGGNVKAASLPNDTKQFAEGMSTMVPGAGECGPISRIPYSGSNTKGTN